MNQKKAGQTILAFYVVHAGERIRRVFTCDYSLFALASDGAAGSGPIPSGVHDEVLPRDQREGGDEEDHRTLRTHRQTAGPFFFFFLRLGTGTRFVGFTPGMDVVDVLPAPPQFPTTMLRI